jgi:hypothetical protein
MGTFIACPWPSLLFVALSVSRNLFGLKDFKAIVRLTLFTELMKVHSLVHGFGHIFQFPTNNITSSVKQLFEQT